MLIAILGWLILVGLGLYCIVAGFMAFFVASIFSEGVKWVFLVFIVAGIALLAIAYWQCPFSISFGREGA
ncbi:MAG: hypothetical protein GAK35_02643 [Herbaspirillum frisingense]|uniref:Uncharacterized protein n=1 Tax=Herbaspirillum frisingense TaxID=92645 RepID=A0A7V8FVS0_9BURK|nr:MAG: hypothetical protein GAK35_02643 [Herbaspirillum frisingense]